jgi:L-amino acid N-acyltransferase YncA
MAIICTANTQSDLEGILLLQRENLAQNVTEEEKLDQGFVMVSHKLSDLQDFSKYAPQLILKEGGKVVGYLLAMSKSLRETVPMLKPMFEQIDQITHSGKEIRDSNYLIVGQVCIGKEFRGLGLIDEMFAEYQKIFEEDYDFAITEIVTTNSRSIRAHLRVGFEIIHKFKDEFQEWNIVLWDWKTKKAIAENSRPQSEH